MATYIQIGSTVTVGAGGAANITFSSIPSTYTDLLVKLSSRTSSASLETNVMIGFNGSTASFTNKYVAGNGSGTFSGSYARLSGKSPAATATSSTFGNTEIYIPNYAGSANKSYSSDSVAETNGSSITMQLNAGLWSVTSAITSIELTSDGSDNFVQYSTATLYGILKS
jgi:hypothetical protein